MGSEMARLLAQADSASVQASSRSAQAKVAIGQTGRRNKLELEKSNIVSNRLCKYRAGTINSYPRSIPRNFLSVVLYRQQCEAGSQAFFETGEDMLHNSRPKSHKVPCPYERISRS